MSPRLQALVVAGALLVGAAAGRAAAPALASLDPGGREAGAEAAAPAGDLRERRRRARALLDRVEAVEHRFAAGATLFGAWCGGVLALTAVAAHRRGRRGHHAIDPAACLACVRCLQLCPMDRASPAPPPAAGSPR
jgi:NAD-dependent dihydropyrimidine dehydrogenase PreA subunit